MNGRDLIILPKQTREELENPDNKKKKPADPRNLRSKAIGLTNFFDFKQPKVSEA